MLIGVYTIPVLVTYLGLISSVSAAAFAINGNYKVSVILFMLSAIFDLFDGMIARKMNKSEKENLFGIQIDSIIDACSFGMVPAIIGYSMGMNTKLDFAILLLYVMGATMRLAYFNCLALDAENKNKSGKKFYLGLPVTFSAVLLPIVFVTSYILCQRFDILTLRLTYFIVSILFVVNVKLPKLGGIWYYILPLIMVIWSILTLVVL